MAVLGTTIWSNGKGHFDPTDRNDQIDQSGPSWKLVPNIPVGTNRNGPFHLMYQPKFEWTNYNLHLLHIHLQSIIVREVFAPACDAPLPLPRPRPLPLPLPRPRPSAVPLEDVLPTSPRPFFPVDIEGNVCIKLRHHDVNRGYYTAARRYETSPRMLKNIFARERSQGLNYCRRREEKFLTPNSHVMFYLFNKLYKHQWNTKPFNFNVIFSAKDAIYYVAIATVIFSHGKISYFHWWWLYE